MPNQYKEYTEQEMEIVKQNYGKITCEEICKRFLPHRKPHNIIYLVWKLRKKGLLNLSSTLDKSEEARKKMAETKCGKLPNKSYSLTPSLAYILGAVAGDGYYNHKPYRIYLRCIDKDFADNFKQKLEEWSGLNARIYKAKSSPYSPIKYTQGFCWEVMLNSRKAIEFLEPFDIFRLKEKAVENIKVFLDKSPECEIKFIEGFFDAEGSVRTYNRICFDNSFKPLIDYVSELLKKFGIDFKPYKDKLKDKENFKIQKEYMYRISIQRKEQIAKFCELFNSSISDKQERLNEKKEKYSDLLKSSDIPKKIEIDFELVEPAKRNFKLFEEIIRKYHSYKSTAKIVGRRINWIIRDKNTHQIYGCIGVSNSFLYQGTRDKWIGWNKQTRLKNLKKIANNWRFCLLPNPPKNFASQVLAIFVKEAPKEWKKRYNEELVLIETYVGENHSASCYKGAGWIEIGKTKGYQIIFDKGIRKVGSMDGEKKAIFVKPLCTDWKEKLLK
ncbi:hypothetical protein CCP3SC1AL1_520003 [Gammaproteobacteria bacterium]